jgi:hypothetical protein
VAGALVLGHPGLLAFHDLARSGVILVGALDCLRGI